MTADHADQRPDARALDAEPAPLWFTATVERRFKVGDRVRVRISLECNETWGHEGRIDAHPRWADGVLGRVGSRSGPYPNSADSAESMQRHPIFVLLDEDGPGGTWALWLAAIELEPWRDDDVLA